MGSAEESHVSLIRIDESGLQGFLHRPGRPSGDGLALTHGAGANCQAPLLMALADEFSRAGVTVLRYDLPFRQARAKGPPMRGSSERDQPGIAQAIEWLKHEVGGHVFVGGHSYGGRQTSMLVAARPDATAGLLLLSYPLHPPKAPAQLRTQHFPDIHVPALFVHGTRDGFGTLAEMKSALALVPGPTKLMAIEGAGHELATQGNRLEIVKAVHSAFAAMFLSFRGRF